MKKQFNLLLFILCSTLTFGQASYIPFENISVSYQNYTLKNPFSGGLNAPQFCKMDLNNDGIMDLIIFDRAGDRITPYINNGTANQIDYSYAPSYISAFPSITYWLITGDYDCDGKLDLFSGGSSITVYQNISDADGLKFQKISKIASDYNGFDPTRVPQIAQINPTSINYPAIVDVNNDGDLDIILYNSQGSQVEFHKNLSVERTGTCGLDFQRRSKCWGNFVESSVNRSVFLDSCLISDFINGENIDSKQEVNQIEKDNKHSGSSVSAYDLDANGSLEIIVGDIGSNFLTALYNDDSIFPHVNSHFYRLDTLFPSYDIPAEVPTFPTSFFMDLNNDAKDDFIVSTNNNSKGIISKSKENILFYSNSNTVGTNFKLDPKTNYFYEDMLDFGKDCFPAFFDYNNDGLLDILVGNGENLQSDNKTLVGTLALLVNVGSRTQPNFDLIDNNFLNLPAIPLDISNNAPTSQLIPAFGDIDNDGDQDLLIGDVNGKIHYFEDTSSVGNLAGFQLKTPNYESINVYLGAAPTLFDLDDDNDLDLVIGYNSGRLDYYENFGSPSTPIYTIKIKSISWLVDSMFRYDLDETLDLSQLSIGQNIVVNNSIKLGNNGNRIITVINQAQNYIECIRPYYNSALMGIDDESTTSAVIDYSEKVWGQVSNNFIRNAMPFIYKEDSIIKMLVGAGNGIIYLYDSLENQISDSIFKISDSMFTSTDFGEFARPYGADINNDSIIDFAVGNEAGGFSLLKGYYPANDTTDTTDTGIPKIIVNSNGFNALPNPANQRLTISGNGNDNLLGEVTIYNINGKLIYNAEINSGQLEIETEYWSSGVYIISVKNSNYYKIKKLVVNH